ncbi:MAG: hypothetical protein ACJA2S_003648 [Cyclobacteriaceae bacterium]|jgi:hypothetical protein
MSGMALSVEFMMISAYFSSRKSRCPSGMRRKVREKIQLSSLVDGLISGRRKNKCPL